MRVLLLQSNRIDEIHAPDWDALLAISEGVVWVDMLGPHPDEVKVMREVFRFHPLAIEDTLNRRQRPNAAEYADHAFVIFNPLRAAVGEIGFRELDVFVGRNFIVTVHSGYEPLLKEILERMSRLPPNLPVSVGGMMYLLLDTLINDYFTVLERMEDEIDQIGEIIVEKPQRDMINRLFEFKRRLNEMWRVVGAQKDTFGVLTRLYRETSGSKTLKYYYRDIEDHIGRLLETIKAIRDMVNNLFDLYVSSSSNRLNSVVNRLTVITIVFGSMTVISGFYGMNFESTWPPFESPFGVPYVILLMIVSMIVIYFAFWRRNP